MILYIDIDNTICETQGLDYANSKPWEDKIKKINTLYETNYIVYWTSRGVGSKQNLYDITKKQLDSWGCLYHELRCDKPVYDLFIDDKTIKDISEIEKKTNNKIKLNRYKLCIPKNFDIYKDKNICLLGNGESITKYNIDFNKYDLVVGINRIYLTKYYKDINVLYYNMSKKDNYNLDYLLSSIKNSSNIKYLILCPWCSGPKKRLYLENLINKYGIKNHIYSKSIVRKIPQIQKRPLTGIAALNHILLCGIKSIDIYGFDFYQTKYVDKLQYYSGHEKYHDIGSNFDFFKTLLETHNDKIVWHQ